mmetsp:Transcript_49058/g.49412  ORF Transcript_49058/g.49412 Transcript_49058/m.49412 type:complete len:182 (-) Transcript_49058:535-1080(-)
MFNNIALIHHDKGDVERAIEEYQSALSVRKAQPLYQPAAVAVLSSDQGVSSEYSSFPVSSKSSSNNNDPSASVERPQTVAEYRDRLVRYDKELYKDPPVLRPTDNFVESEIASLHTRHKTTGALTFLSGKNDDDKNHEALLRDFHPNQTPEEVLRAGSFGGTYLRPIVSAVMKQSYNSKQV